MKLTLYQVDAFASQVFTGNPAAVCPLEKWLPDPLLQAIAEENNLAETAFFVPLSGTSRFHLRWFTPTNEEDLCGHATLASAYVLFEHVSSDHAEIHFETRSGTLRVAREGDTLRMTFPATMPLPCDMPSPLIAGLGCSPQATLQAFDYVAVYASEAEIRAIVPDFTKLKELDLRGVIVTAPGTDVDFVSRFFAPKSGIPEDPVTGSAHCELAPYWSARLGRTHLTAKQLSRRGGDLTCRLQGSQVELVGRALHYMTAEITIPDELL